MSLEDDVKAVLIGDSVLTPIFGTRIYTAGAVGENGLTEEATPEIFSSGDLLASILIRMGDTVGDGQVNNYEDKVLSALQEIRLHFYDERVYTNIDIGKARTRFLLYGHIFSGTFELEFVLETGRLRDGAALAGAAYVRQDWSANIIL